MSLTLGTAILMASGDEQAIETLNEGDLVQSEGGPAPVRAYIILPPRRVYTLTLSTGRPLVLTNAHPVATPDGWKALAPNAALQENPGISVTKLFIGSIITTTDGTCSLLDIVMQDYMQTVYNISIDTFYANGVLVGGAQ